MNRIVKKGQRGSRKRGKEVVMLMYKERWGDRGSREIKKKKDSSELGE